MIGLHIPLGRADVHNPLGAVARAENLTISREKEKQIISIFDSSLAICRFFLVNLRISMMP